MLIRADGGSQVGFGHFVRSCALASYLSRDFDCIFTSYSHDGAPNAYQLGLAKASGARWMPLPGGSLEEADGEFLDLIERTGADTVVLDNYYYSTEYQRSVRQRCRRLVCIDDMPTKHIVADLLITVCPLRREDFSLEAGADFLGGPEWMFLRQPFLTPVPERVRTVPPRRVVMAMGGADPHRVTPKLLGILRDIDPGLEIDVVAGPTVFTGIHGVNVNGVNIHSQIGAGEMCALMDRADLGIFPASSVCIEAFSRRLPVAAGHYADNQQPFYDYGVRHGWFAPLGSLLDPEPELRQRMQRVLSMENARPAVNFDPVKNKEIIISKFKEL